MTVTNEGTETVGEVKEVQEVQEEKVQGKCPEKNSGAGEIARAITMNDKIGTCSHCKKVQRHGAGNSLRRYPSGPRN